MDPSDFSAFTGKEDQSSKPQTTGVLSAEEGPTDLWDQMEEMEAMVSEPLKSPEWSAIVSACNKSPSAEHYVDLVAAQLKHSLHRSAQKSAIQFAKRCLAVAVAQVVTMTRRGTKDLSEEFLISEEVKRFVFVHLRPFIFDQAVRQELSDLKHALSAPKKSPQPDVPKEKKAKAKEATIGDHLDPTPSMAVDPRSTVLKHHDHVNVTGRKAQEMKERIPRQAPATPLGPKLAGMFWMETTSFPDLRVFTLFVDSQSSGYIARYLPGNRSLFYRDPDGGESNSASFLIPEGVYSDPFFALGVVPAVRDDGFWIPSPDAPVPPTPAISNTSAGYSWTRKQLAGLSGPVPLALPHHRLPEDARDFEDLRAKLAKTREHEIHLLLVVGPEPDGPTHYVKVGPVLKGGSTEIVTGTATTLPTPSQSSVIDPGSRVPTHRFGGRDNIAAEKKNEAEATFGSALKNFFTGLLKEVSGVDLEGAFKENGTDWNAIASGTGRLTGKVAPKIVALIGECDEALKMDPASGVALSLLMVLSAHGALTPAGMATLRKWWSAVASFGPIMQTQTVLGPDGNQAMNSMQGWADTTGVIPLDRINSDGTMTPGQPRAYRFNVGCMVNTTLNDKTVMDGMFASIKSAIDTDDTAVLGPFMKQADATVAALGPGAILNYLRTLAGVAPSIGNPLYVACALAKKVACLYPMPGANVPFTMNTFLQHTATDESLEAIAYPGIFNSAGAPTINAYYTNLTRFNQFRAGVSNVWNAAVSPNLWDISAATGVIVVPLSAQISNNNNVAALWTMLHLAHLRRRTYAANFVDSNGTVVAGPTTTMPAVETLIFNRPQQTVLFVNVDSLTANVAPVLTLNGPAVNANIPFENAAAVDIGPVLWASDTNDNWTTYWEPLLRVYSMFYGVGELGLGFRFVAPYVRHVPLTPPVVRSGTNYGIYRRTADATASPDLYTVNAATAAQLNVCNQPSTCHFELPTALLEAVAVGYQATGTAISVGDSASLIDRAAGIVKVGQYDPVPDWVRSPSQAALTLHEMALAGKAFFCGQANGHGISLNTFRPLANNATAVNARIRLEATKFSHWRRIIQANSGAVYSFNSAADWGNGLVQIFTAEAVSRGISLGSVLTINERIALFGPELPKFKKSTWKYLDQNSRMLDPPIEGGGALVGTFFSDNRSYVEKFHDWFGDLYQLATTVCSDVLGANNRFDLFTDILVYNKVLRTALALPVPFCRPGSQCNWLHIVAPYTSGLPVPGPATFRPSPFVLPDREHYAGLETTEVTILVPQQRLLNLTAGPTLPIAGMAPIGAGLT